MQAAAFGTIDFVQLDEVIGGDDWKRTGKAALGGAAAGATAGAVGGLMTRPPAWGTVGGGALVGGVTGAACGAGYRPGDHIPPWWSALADQAIAVDAVTRARVGAVADEGLAIRGGDQHVGFVSVALAVPDIESLERHRGARDRVGGGLDLDHAIPRNSHSDHAEADREAF